MDEFDYRKVIKVLLEFTILRHFLRTDGWINFVGSAKRAILKRASKKTFKSLVQFCAYNKIAFLSYETRTPRKISCKAKVFRVVLIRSLFSSIVLTFLDDKILWTSAVASIVFTSGSPKLLWTSNEISYHPLPGHIWTS